MTPADDNSFATTSGNKKATYTLICVKVVELCLLICCLGLIDEPATNSHLKVFITPRVIALCYVTFGALAIHTAVYLIMALFGDLTPWRTSALWALVGFALYIVVTALLFRDWATTKDRNYWHPNMHRLDLVMATASISLVTALVYLLDILLTIRFGVHGDLE